MTGDDDDKVIAFPGATAAPPPAREEGEAAGSDEVAAVPEELLVQAIEACLFAMPGVVTGAQLETALRLPRARVEAGVDVLRERLLRTGAGLRVVDVGDGWQLRTDPRLASWVAAVRGGKPFRLSRAALETLAVVAFRQPVPKAVVDDIRGVDCGGILRSLLDRGLVRMAGRSDEPGRPMTYGTTPAFLELFGLRSLADLPTLKDLRQLADDDPEESVVPVVPFPVPEPGPDDYEVVPPDAHLDPDDDA